EEHVWTPPLITIIDQAVSADVTGAKEMKNAIIQQDYSAFDEAYHTYTDAFTKAGYDLSQMYNAVLGDDVNGVPEPSAYGIWIPGIPVMMNQILESIHTASWLQSLIVEGIIGGVGAVLGFVPQMIVLFLLLAFLEACGYMSRIAFVLDRIFRKFNLSGKSFIPMLIGTGCGVPGIMASRTIENESDRRMTIMTTTFIPCGAKLPIIAMIASALFHGAWWVAP
ncbi:nucleoside recognition domain-containing protein, partial [Absiella sp. AM09-45]|uniref:nucleoside recognition domain-containing protein n=1 Tax=Absiella sp. AM09-45 TaxID=2291993 RepID=UPI0029420E4F